jgi:hypothetical protein
MDSAPEMDVGLVMAGPDRAESPQSLEMVLYPVPEAVEASMKEDTASLVRLRMDAGRDGLGTQLLAKGGAVKCIVGDDPLAPRRTEVFGHLEVGTLSWCLSHLNGTACAIDQCKELGVPSPPWCVRRPENNGLRTRWRPSAP